MKTCWRAAVLGAVATLALLVTGCSAAESVAPFRRAPIAKHLGESAPPYDRKSWRHWIDADRDCQDTRTEVLVAESLEPVEFADAYHCRVRRGRWACPYTGRTVTDPAELDIDHLVPLQNAHRSGGWRWPPEKKAHYSNDLDHNEHLVAVLASANRAKGSKGPESWLPSNARFICEYVREWQAVKQRWSLTMTPAERQKMTTILAECN